jgi:hypothetical protein
MSSPKSKTMLFLVGQLASASVCLYFCYHIPPPGFAVSFLAALTFALGYRGEVGKVMEKVLWVTMVILLMFLEFRSISGDRWEQAQALKSIFDKQIGISQQIATLRAVQQAPSATVLKILEKPEKRRSFVAWQTDRAGISTENDADRGRLFVNVICSNVGQEVAKVTACDAKMYIHEGGPDAFAKNKEQQQSYFEDFLVSSKPRVQATLLPGENKWFSTFGPYATSQLIDQLNSGQKLIIVVGTLSYNDQQGRHKNELCRWMQPPITDPKPVWHGCIIHDGER